MRFKAKQGPQSRVPEVNLVPMMDVLMTVLTFFIIISMTLSAQQVLTVDAPEAEEAATLDQDIAVEPLVVGLNRDGEIVLSDRPVDEQTLVDAVANYLIANPDGYLRLKADRDLPYEEVSEVLQTLQAIAVGRDVTLMVE